MRCNKRRDRGSVGNGALVTVSLIVTVMLLWPMADRIVAGLQTITGILP